MIGKAYWAIFKYYDSSAHMMAFKKRPVLIIGQADESDYVVLPISRVTRREHIDQKYDFKKKLSARFWRMQMRTFMSISMNCCRESQF